MKENLKEILDKEFLGNLPNRGIPNSKPVMVIFSGIPESGISVLAQRVTDHFQGLLINKDQARTLVYENEEINSTQEPEDILDDYFEFFVKEVAKLPNKFLVIDASVDRRYENYKNWAKELGYEIFLVEVNSSRDIISKNIVIHRDEQTAKWFNEQLPRWQKDHEDFVKNHTPNIIVNELSEYDINCMLTKINSLVSS